MRIIQSSRAEKFSYLEHTCSIISEWDILNLVQFKGQICLMSPSFRTGFMWSVTCTELFLLQKMFLKSLEMYMESSRTEENNSPTGHVFPREIPWAKLAFTVTAGPFTSAWRWREKRQDCFMVHPLALLTWAAWALALHTEHCHTNSAIDGGSVTEHTFSFLGQKWHFLRNDE